MKPLAHTETIALYLAICPQQLAALIRADWRRIEPGQGGEHFMFLKVSQRYAEMIARQCLVPLHGAAYVARLVLPERVMQGYDIETMAYEEHLEYRIPTCELDPVNGNILGEVAVVSAFLDRQSYSVPLGSRPLAGLLG